MRAFIVYRPGTEHERAVTDYLRDFKQRTGRDLDTVNADTREGADICRLYDVMQYPSVVAVDDLGVLQNIWQGLPLPLMNEVSYYV